MVAPLAAAAMAEPERHGNAWAQLDRAREIAEQLPLVHRTCKRGSYRSLGELLQSRRFVARAPATGVRELAAGIPRAAYFFLGCGAYPLGRIGFVLDADLVLSRPSSFTPIDSGSLQKHASPADPERAWDDAAKQQFLSEHLGRGADVRLFAGPYLATHFRDPAHYLFRPQQSKPDFNAYHGLSSGDRRDYTIEVQAHQDVPLEVSDGSVLEIVVADEDLLEDLPDELLDRVRVVSAENEVLEAIADGISRRMQAVSR